jgi:hypothetical protein
VTENANKQNRGFQSEEARKRSLIQSIEQTLDTRDQLKLNSISLNTFANQINEVVTWVRNNDGHCRQGKNAVLSNLREARIQIQAACSEFDKNSRSKAFLRTVEQGREFLEKSLTAW